MAKNLIMKKLEGYPVALAPCYADGEDIMGKLKTTKHYKVTIKESRNPEFHKLAFAFLNNVFEYQNHYTDREMLRDALSIMAGHVHLIEIRSNRTFIKVKSWAFDEMDELEFQPLIAKIVAAAIKRFDLPPNAPWIPQIFVEDYEI